MVEIIIAVIIGVGGFFAGWISREQVAIRKIDQMMNKIGDNLEQVKASLIQISIEKHKEAYYVYNMKDNSFMGQGNNRKELEDLLASKYPGKSFAAAHDNLVELGWENESF